MLCAISFIGIGPTNGYQPATYELKENGQIRTATETKFFPKVIQELFKPEQLFVIMTKEAEAKYFAELSKVCDFKPLRVKSGKNELELWGMFEVITNEIPENAHLILDVTHSFRSQPMVLLAIAIYLQVAKKVVIEKILYGAFEAKDATNKKAPIFDLKPFLDLITWSSATEQFLKYGNTAVLKDFLNSIQNATRKEATSIHKATALESISNSLSELTGALSVNRIGEAIKKARNLPENFEKVSPDIQNLPNVKPLEFLLSKVRQKLDKLTKAKGLFTPEGFEAQAQMIEFYLETQQYVQAITLAREVYVSKRCIVNKKDPMEHEDREFVRKQLVKLIQSNHRKTLPKGNEQDIAELWQQITDCRNDVNHAGMGKKSTEYEKVIENINKLCNKIISFITDKNGT